jgi:hypothetical protein
MPAVTGVVPGSQGQEWIELMNANRQVFLHIADPAVAERFIYSIKDSSGGYTSSKSSWGLSAELDVKPQFAAPGWNIASTIPLAQGGYGIKSGTSMATPFLAGVYALLIESRKTRDPQLLQRLLSSTANANVFYDGNRAHDNLAPVPQQGAGLIQAYAAAKVTTLLSVGSFSFNDTENSVSKANFTIQNTGLTDVTYRIGHSKAATVYTLRDGAAQPAPFPPEVVDGSASLSFSATSIPIPAGQSVSVTVTPTLPEGLNSLRLPVYSGYITINGTNGDALAIPYAGLAGSMKASPVIDPLSVMIEDFHTGDPMQPNDTFTIPVPTSPQWGRWEDSPGLPAFLFAHVIGTPLEHVFLIPHEINGQLNTTDYLGLKVAGDIYTYPRAYLEGITGPEVAFTGMLPDGTIVPEGRYEFRILALKIFGNKNKLEDYQSISYPFYIRYQK